MDLRNDPYWRIGRRITRLIDDRFGQDWGPTQHRLAERMLSLWQAGQLHEVQLADWLDGRIKLPS